MAASLSHDNLKMTSTPKSSFENRSGQLKDAARSILDLLANCVNNSEETTKVCAKFKTELPNAPAELKQIVERIEEDSQSITKLRERINELSESLKIGNHDQMKKEFQMMVDGIENISRDKIQLLSDVFCLAETSKVKKRIETTERELSSLNPNLLTEVKLKNFAKLLNERNQMLIECLKSVRRTLPKVLDEQTGSEMRELNLTPRNVNRAQQSRSLNQSQQSKKLFIFKESLEHRLPLHKQLKLVGKVIIEGMSQSNSQSSQLQERNATTAGPREYLTGYLENHDGKREEVVLKLKKLAEQSMSTSGTRNATQHHMTARIEIDGNLHEESIPIVEVDVKDFEEPRVIARAIATVENESTGLTQSVEVSVVPTSPGKQVHGKILKLRPATTNHSMKDADRTEMPTIVVDESLSEFVQEEAKAALNKSKLFPTTRSNTSHNRSENLDDISQPSFNSSDRLSPSNQSRNRSNWIGDTSQPEFPDSLEGPKTPLSSRPEKDFRSNKKSPRELFQNAHSPNNQSRNRSDWIGDTSQPNFPNSSEALTSSTVTGNQDASKLKKKGPRERFQQAGRAVGPLSLALKQARGKASRATQNSINKMIEQEAGAVVDKIIKMAQNLSPSKIVSPLDGATSQNTSRFNNVPTALPTSFAVPMSSILPQNYRPITSNRTNLMDFSAKSTAKSGGRVSFERDQQQVEGEERLNQNDSQISSSVDQSNFYEGFASQNQRPNLHDILTNKTLLTNRQHVHQANLNRSLPSYLNGRQSTRVARNYQPRNEFNFPPRKVEAVASRIAEDAFVEDNAVDEVDPELENPAASVLSRTLENLDDTLTQLAAEINLSSKQIENISLLQSNTLKAFDQEEREAIEERRLRGQQLEDQGVLSAKDFMARFDLGNDEDLGSESSNMVVSD